ncbi:MAG: glycosyltransferase family 2 protein [Phycisphaerales bacterium]|nr:MAG: glycosyltransferase family 2 protein [Phycisphaerales bacterium]
MATVSVIIPLYNKGPYIRRTLESVLAQTWQDFEIVVVDDGSTDDGPAIVRAYPDPRVRLIQQANQGPGAARNHGIRASTAPYLAFLDADDEWLPGFLEKAAGTLKDHDDCLVFVTNYFLDKERDTYLGCHPEVPLEPGINRLPVDISPELTKACVNMFAQGAVVIHRGVVDHLGGYYEDGCTYGEDTYLWLRVLLHYPLYMCEEPLLRIHYDASTLVRNRPTSHPVHVLVKHATEILDGSPAQYRGLLKGLLDQYALTSLWRRLDDGDYAAARTITERFPYSRRYRSQFLKARIKLRILPWLASHNILHRTKSP